ncbi:MAG TPA: hypothetical protein DCQ00_01820 [Phascolarctobacterium succinatutens]|nr:hypothetical protein [Phascolarctobacterium succinatutens]
MDFHHLVIAHAGRNAKELARANAPASSFFGYAMFSIKLRLIKGRCQHRFNSTFIRSKVCRSPEHDFVGKNKAVQLTACTYRHRSLRQQQRLCHFGTVAQRNIALFTDKHYAVRVI